MASDSMHALLSVTLAGCFVRGTSVTESGLTVSTDRLPGEIILFFKTDSPEGPYLGLMFASSMVSSTTRSWVRSSAGKCDIVKQATTLFLIISITAE